MSRPSYIRAVGDTSLKIEQRKNGHAWTFDMVTKRTRDHERRDVYANRNAAKVPDLAPALKYISWESYAAMREYA